MNFEYLEKILARNSSLNSFQNKSVNAETSIQNMSLNNMLLQNDKQITDFQHITIPSHMSPKDLKGTADKSFLTNDNISFNLQTMQLSSTQTSTNETMGLLKEQLTKIKLLTNDLQIKDQQIEIIKDQVQELENDKMNLEQHIYNLEKSLKYNEDDFNLRLLSLQEKNESLQEYNQQIQERIQIQNEQVQTYKEDLAQYRIIVERYDQDKQNLLKEVTQVKGVLKDIQQNSMDSREQMVILIKENENKANELEKKKEFIESLEMEALKNNQKIQKLERIILQKDENINEQEQQLQKLDKIANENQRYSQENSQLRVDFNALKIRFEESMRSLEDARNNISKQIQTKNQFEENLDNVSRELQISKKTYTELKKKNEQLITESLQLKEQLIEFEQVNRRLQRDQNIVIHDLAEYAKDTLDDFEGDDFLHQLYNHSSQIKTNYHEQENINNINKSLNKSQNQGNGEGDDGMEEDDTYQLKSHNKSVQSTSFLNQSKQSIKEFQNSIISNKLTSLDVSRDNKKIKNSKYPPQQTQKKTQTKRKISLSSQKTNNIPQVDVSIKKVNIEEMSSSEQLRTRIGYLGSMVTMYKKKVKTLESQQSSLNETIEKLQDNVDELQKITIINNAQQENSLLQIREEYEEQIIRSKEIYDQKLDDHLNQQYAYEEQIINLQGEIQFQKNVLDEKNSELFEMQQKYFETQKQNVQINQLNDNLSNNQSKIELLLHILEQMLFGYSNIYNKYYQRQKDFLLYKKFFDYYLTINQVINPFETQSKILQNKQESLNMVSQNKKQYIYNIFRKIVYSILFTIRIKKSSIQYNNKQSHTINWTNKFIKNSLISNKKYNSENMVESIRKIIDQQNNLNYSQTKVSDTSLQTINQLMDVFSQQTQLNLNIKIDAKSKTLKKDDSLSKKFLKDANKVSKLIKQNETFQIELNKMTQRVLQLSEYTKQIENQFKDQEKSIEIKYINEIKDKVNIINLLKNQLDLSNSIKQNQSFSSDQIKQIRSTSSMNNRSNVNENIPSQNQETNKNVQQSSLQQIQSSTVSQPNQRQFNSESSEQSSQLIKNQSSLIKKYQVSDNRQIQNSTENIQHSQSINHKNILYGQNQKELQLHQSQNQKIENTQQNYDQMSNFDCNNSSIQNDHVSIDSLQSELSKIMQKRNLRDSSHNSSGSKLNKCPGKIVRNNK